MREVAAIGAFQRLLKLFQQVPQRREALEPAACNECVWPHPGDTLTTCTDRRPTMESPRVVTDPEILGGTPVFVGTRVPVRVLFEHLEAGDSLEVFLQDFPSVSRALAVQVLEDARAALLPDAHPA
jgi:uncharacterized protein (DUF433 family)